MIIEMLLLAIAISIDTLVAGFGYGVSKIKIPISSALAICTVDSCFFGISALIGYFLKGTIPVEFTKWISFSILLLVGLIRTFSGLIKLALAKLNQKVEPIKIKLFNFHLFLNVVVDKTKADIDKNKVLSPLEAISMAVVLAIDEIGVGLSAGMIYKLFYILIIFNLLGCLTSILLGQYIGKKLSTHFKDISWVGGIVLVALALSKLF